MKNGRISIGVEDSVTFDSGSTVLKDSANKVLSNVVSVLNKRFAGHRLYIAGHTDSDPISRTKDKYRDNMDLSCERADAVRRALSKLGIAESAMVVVGYGQFEPRDGKGGKASNRRVEIVVGEERR